MLIQRIKINLFDRQEMVVASIIAATPGGFTNLKPIGGAIASAVKTILLDKGSTSARSCA